MAATVVTAVERAVQSLLQIGVSVTTGQGRRHALVEVHGELCALTAPTLRTELDQLIDDDLSDITIDLSDVRLCTSHALDMFDNVAERLGKRHGGCLHLRVDGAARVVQRTIHLLDDDPTFSPEITETPAASERMAPHERPGDSTS